MRLDSAARGPPASTRRSPLRVPGGLGVPLQQPCRLSPGRRPARRARLEHLELQHIQEHRLQIPLALGQTHPQVRAVPDHRSRDHRGGASLPGHHRQHALAHVGVEQTGMGLTAEAPLDQRGQHPAHLSRGRQPRGRNGMRCGHLPRVGTSPRTRTALPGAAAPWRPLPAVAGSLAPERRRADFTRLSPHQADPSHQDRPRSQHQQGNHCGRPAPPRAGGPGSSEPDAADGRACDGEDLPHADEQGRRAHGSVAALDELRDGVDGHEDGYDHGNYEHQQHEPQDHSRGGPLRDPTS